MGGADPIDVGMPAGSRAALAGSAVGFEDLHVQLARQERNCPRRGRKTAGHGSFREETAHAVGHAPCGPGAKAPRRRREKRGAAVGEEVGFASAVSANITEALEERVAGLLRQRAIAEEAAALRDAPHDTARPAAGGAHAGEPKLPKAPLMGEARACSRRDRDTGEPAAARWACAYDGEDGRPAGVIDGHGSAAPGRRHPQLAPEERNRAKGSCPGMSGPLPDAAAERLPPAVRAAGRSRVAKDGAAHMGDARRRTREGAGNGAPVKRRARKPAVQPGKRARRHAGGARAGRGKRAARDVLRRCDEKRSQLRQALPAFRPCYGWRDGDRGGGREECGRALRDWAMKTGGPCVPEIAAFGQAVADRRRQPAAGTAGHADSARTGPPDDEVGEPERRGRGFGGYAETRKRLPVALGKPDAVELPTARARRLAQTGARKAEAKEKATAKRRRGKRKRR